MSKVLFHHPSPGVPPVGVWWLPKHRSVPKGYYLDDRYYTQGAVVLYGVPYNGEPFTLAQWENRVRDLADSANPLHVWSVQDSKEDPRELLAKAQT